MLLLVQSGCIKKTISLPPNERLLPAKDATRAELLQALVDRSSQIESLQAAQLYLDLTQGSAKSGVLDQYRQTRGVIVVERPCHIRIQVQAPVVLTTVATMVSDCKKYWLSIPYPGSKFGEADVNAPIKPTTSLTNLRPALFLEGLFVDVRAYVIDPNVKFSLDEEVQGRHSYYVFTVTDITNAGPFAEVLQRIWIDRTDLRVARKQVFGKDGALQTDAQYQNYQEIGGISFPQDIVIERPLEAVKVKITMSMDNLKLNEKVDPSVWDLARPEGAENIELTPR